MIMLVMSETNSIRCSGVNAAVFGSANLSSGKGGRLRLPWRASFPATCLQRSHDALVAWRFVKSAETAGRQYDLSPATKS